MEHDPSFLVDCSDEDEPTRFSLLGGADDEFEGEGSYDEGDYGDFDEGDEGDYFDDYGRFSMADMCSKYFWPIGFQLDDLGEYDPPVVYGTNFRGVNLFGLYFWGVIMTIIMELMYIGISKSRWTAPTVFNYGEEGDLAWQFTRQNVADTKTVFFIIWGVILFLFFATSVVRYTMQTIELKGSVVGSSFAIMLLILAFIPAGLAGGWWENEMGALELDDPELSYDHPGFILLVVVPVLWPMVSNCFVVVGSMVLTAGTMFKNIYMPDSWDDGYWEGDEGDWEGDEGDESYFNDAES